MKNKKVLITGAAGFIGFHLAKKLVADGYHVIGIDNINDYYDVNLKLARLRELGIDTSNFVDNELMRSIIGEIDSILPDIFFSLVQ